MNRKICLNNITRGIVLITFIIGLFKVTGIEAVGNQKVSTDSKQNFDAYDYSDETDVSNGDVLAPKSTVKPYFESNFITVYATKEVENITMECSPKNFNDSRYQILWYNGEHPITNGNTSLALEKYSIDNKFRLTVFNYNKNSGGNFSCAVLPTDVRQYVSVEFSTPPENITDRSGASTIIFVKMEMMFSYFIVMFSMYEKFLI